jgi:uncharacterized membrane protein
MLSTDRPVRLPIVDVLRGLAVAQMIVYHFIYDLSFFGWYGTVLARDPGWIAWRSAIVAQFVLLVGVSLALRAQFRPAPADFWRRWVQLAAAAALVSVGSWLAFGPRFIWFGVLHFAAAALLLLRPLVRLGPWNLLLAAGVVLIWVLVADPRLDATPLNAIGLGTIPPRKLDHVPLFPWLAGPLAGIGIVSLWQQRQFRLPPALVRLNERPPRLLRWFGSWPLTIYLVHQPVLMGLLWLVKQLGSR